MLFNSWEFVLFFLAILLIFFSIPHRYRIYLLLGASYYFYMSWRWQFGFLMFGVSWINFYSGKKIAEGRFKRAWMSLAVLVSMLPLVYYKYGNFLLDSFEGLSGFLGKGSDMPELNLILPVGISFFSFQALSYSIDVYRKQIDPEKNLIKFLTFISFFPQLVAGPIERSGNLLPQFEEEKKFDFDRAVQGGKLFIWGLFKKVVIADRLGLYSDPVFNNPEAYSGPSLILATLFFTFQIYCDFSGYSDMAIGIARIMGFKLMQNFNLPYLSRSIAEFWKRWHISLSSWFGDYLYFPLGGNRVPIPRWILNIFIVFLVSGLWHGANWTFVVWGALHGFYYVVEFTGKKVLSNLGLARIMEYKWYRVMKMTLVFLMVAFAWVFFRANSMGDAILIVNKMVFDSGSLWMGSSAVTTILSLALIGFLILIQVMQFRGLIGFYFKPSVFPKPVTWFAFLFLLIGISLFGVSSNAFIYFQF